MGNYSFPFIIGAQNIANGAIISSKIADGAVTNPKVGLSAITTNNISDSAVNSPKIKDGSVINTKIADNSITTGKIGDGNVTGRKISKSIISSRVVELSGYTYWTPSAGTYNVVCLSIPLIYQIYADGAWRGHNQSCNATIYTYDGTHMRVYNSGVYQNNLAYQML